MKVDNITKYFEQKKVEGFTGAITVNIYRGIPSDKIEKKEFEVIIPLPSNDV